MVNQQKSNFLSHLKVLMETSLKIKSLVKILHKQEISTKTLQFEPLVKKLSRTNYKNQNLCVVTKWKTHNLLLHFILRALSFLVVTRNL